MSTTIPPNVRRWFEILGIGGAIVGASLTAAFSYGELNTEMSQTRSDLDDASREITLINERVRRLEIDAASDTERLKQLSESISRQSEALERIEERLEQIHPRMRRRD